MAEQTLRTIPVGNASATEWSGQAPVIRPEPWTKAALCAQVDPEIFFPESGDRHASAAARKICAACPVRAACLEYATRTCQRHGIWAGMSRLELQRIRNGRAA